MIKPEKIIITALIIAVVTFINVIDLLFRWKLQHSRVFCLLGTAAGAANDYRRHCRENLTIRDLSQMPLTSVTHTIKDEKADYVGVTLLDLLNRLALRGMQA